MRYHLTDTCHENGSHTSHSRMHTWPGFAALRIAAKLPIMSSKIGMSFFTWDSNFMPSLASTNNRAKYDAPNDATT